MGVFEIVVAISARKINSKILLMFFTSSIDGCAVHTRGWG
jgi:hypothetical protein